MDLTEPQLKTKIAWQAAEIERLTTENTRLRSALADRQIITGEITLKDDQDKGAPADADTDQ